MMFLYVLAAGGAGWSAAETLLHLIARRRRRHLVLTDAQLDRVVWR